MKVHTKRKLAAAAASTAVLATALVGAAGPAQAASASQAASICGAGYYPIWEDDSFPASRIYISYNGSTDCAVNIKTDNVGTPSSVYVYLQGPNASWGGNADDGSWDGGNYSYYAGPVYTYAPHDCVYWGGGDGYVSDDWGPGLCG